MYCKHVILWVIRSKSYEEEFVKAMPEQLCSNWERKYEFETLRTKSSSNSFSLGNTEEIRNSHYDLNKIVQKFKHESDISIYLVTFERQSNFK